MPLRHPPSQSFDDVVVIDSPSPCLPARTLPNPINFHSDPTEVIDLDMSPTPALDDHHAPRKRRRRDHSSPDSPEIPTVIDVDAVDEDPSPRPGPSTFTRLQTSTPHRSISRDLSNSPPPDPVVPSSQAATRRNSGMSDEVIETAASGPRLSAQRQSPPATSAPSRDLDSVTRIDHMSRATPSVEIVDIPPRSADPPPSNQRARRSMPSLAPTTHIGSIDSSIEPVSGQLRSGNISRHIVSDTSTPRPAVPRSAGSRPIMPLASNRLIPPYIISAVPHSLSGPSGVDSAARSTRRIIVPVYEFPGGAVAGSATAFTGLRSGPGGVPRPSERDSENRFAPMVEIERLLRQSLDATPMPSQSASGQGLNPRSESGAQGAAGRRLRHDPEIEITEIRRRTSNISSQATPPSIATFPLGRQNRRLAATRPNPTTQPAITPQELHVQLPSGPAPAFVAGHAAGSRDGENPRARLRSRGSSSRRATDARSMVQEVQQQLMEIQHQIPILEDYPRRSGLAQSRNNGRLGTGRGSAGAGPSTGVSAGLYYPVSPIRNRGRSGRTSVTASTGSRGIRFGAHILFRDRRVAHPNMNFRLFQQLSGDQHLDYENLVRLDEQLLREKNRAEKEQIDALPVQKATAADKEIRCCVCMCDVEVGEELRVLPCNHKYHKSCIDEWLTYNGCCPVCKKRIGPPRSRRRNDMWRENQLGNQ